MKLRHIAAVLVLPVCVASCSLFETPAPQPKRIDPDSYTFQTYQKAAFKRLEAYRLTVKSGTRISEFLNTLSNTGVITESALNVSEMYYTGPTLNSVNALEALEIVLGHTVLDFELIHEGIRVIPSSYKRLPAKVKMTGEDWMLVLNATDQMLLKDVSGTEVQVGFVLDDRLAHVFMVNAPLSVRYRISEFIHGFNAAKMKKDLKVEDDNVQIGVIERVNF